MSAAIARLVSGSAAALLVVQLGIAIGASLASNLGVAAVLSQMIGHAGLNNCGQSYIKLFDYLFVYFESWF
ncbi:hypothetical protein [Pseudomonas aeruginosa]|uniref:hypothetical protein n=1 Tax=Pseudomonas aeruginosa TaxID=287 RepID=UPI003FD2B791